MSNTRRLKATRHRPGCERCGRKAPRQPEGWNATVASGVVVGILCPRCQTPEENAEAEVNLATLTYDRSPDGWLRAVPRQGAGCRPIQVDGWGVVGLFFMADGEQPAFIIPPIIEVDGQLVQGVNLLTAIASQPEGSAGIPVPHAKLTQAEVAELEQLLALEAEKLGGVEIHWDWSNEPAENNDVRRLLDGPGELA